MKNKPIEISQGSKLLHPLYGTLEVLSFRNSKSVDVLFHSTGTRVTVQSKDIQSMSIKDYNHPYIFGVGYRGYGPYKCYKDNAVTKAYSVWRSMLQRCYDESCNSYRFYSDCSVCIYWHNFQNFAEWYYSNYKDGHHVDKDTKLKGNKIYSSSTCLFIPAKENVKFATQKKHSFTSPSGDVISFVNLNEFCLANNLDRINMSRVSNGHRKSHKGWTSSKLIK